MAAAQQSVGAVPLSTLCPKFLHTNSTSHTWPFSAIAELIDNAYDPDVNAKQIWIDKTQIKDKECLTFMDNGNGLSHEMMHRMLSFGYSDKKAVNDKHPIGMYGNGFKSGSMRLGQDAIVFSKSKNDLCVGMLSQSYLKETGAKQVTVPIISFEKISTNKFRVPLQHKASLQEILRYSPFTTEEELIIELRAIMSTCSEKATGTRIIIWNLRRTSAGKAEFDFTTDRYDIRIPCDVFDTISKPYTRPERITSSSPDSDSSLRAYCSILYLKPRMQIIIRGQKVKTQLISKSLAYIAKDSYKPAFVNKSIPIIFGYNTKSKEQYGIMMYYKNRLIKAYERVGCQLKANNNGVGVIGVVMCDFLEPTHNKQDFDNTDKYRKTIQSLGIKLEEYWKEIRFKRNKDNPNNNTPVEDTQKRPDQNWAQCHKCLKWRKLPDGIDCDRLPEEWFCYLNPDPVFRHCEKEEEQEDSDSEQHTNMKTYKKHEREDKKKQEEQRLKVWESKKRLEEEKVAKLARQNESLRLQQELLKERLNQMISSPAVGHSQSSPKTRRAGLQVKTPQRGASRDCNPPPTGSNLSQDACSPSTSSGLPIIVNTFSLPTTPSRVKRPQPKSPLSWSKRVRLSETISTVDPMSSVSPPTTAPVEDLDDDFIIIECSSTPIPKGHDVNLARVKMESGPVDARYGMASGGNVVQESSATGNCTAEVAAVGTHLPLLPPPGMVSTVTQTVAPRVKREEVDEQMNQSNGGMSISQAQEQQDRLIELMQTVSQERDSFQEQVDELNVKLKDMQTRLKQITDTVIKKESVDQTSQTEDGEDYKALYEQARQKVEELSREKEMMEANLLFPRPLHQNPENETPVGELSTDQSNKEGHGLHLKVAQIKEEKANINLEGLRSGTERDSHTQTTATGPNVKNEADESSIASHEEATRSLVELRHNVGRLLLSYIPLELNQVNFNCNVIDEILEQVLNDQSCLVPINIAGYKTN